MHIDDTLKEMQKSTPVNLLWIIIDRIGLSLYIIQLPIIYNAMLNRKQPIPYDGFLIVSIQILTFHTILNLFF